MSTPFSLLRSLTFMSEHVCPIFSFQAKKIAGSCFSFPEISQTLQKFSLMRPNSSLQNKVSGTNSVFVSITTLCSQNIK